MDTDSSVKHTTPPMKKETKTILHLIATNFFGGPEKQIIEHLSRLNKDQFRGVFASFLEGRPNETLERAQQVGLPNFSIPMSSPFDVRALYKLTKLLRKQKVDLLCVHGYKACVMGWLAAKVCRIPAIAFSRGYTAENRKVAFYEWLERRVLGRMTGIISVSEAQGRRLQSFGIRNKRSWVVRNAVSIDSKNSQNTELRMAVFKKLGIPVNSKLVVTAGRLSPEKGHRHLIDAIARMGGKSKRICFAFCGDGPCASELEKQALDLGVYGKCRFAGFRRDLPEIFQAMDLMVLPSLTEGLPNVVLEAFASAKPVVASAVGGVPEIVEQGVNGFLVPPEDPDALAQAIEKCLSCPELMRTMGDSGQRKVRSEFSFELQNTKLEEIYDQILGRDALSAMTLADSPAPSFKK